MDPRPISPEEVLQNAGFLSRLARGLVADRHAAEELVQDAWVAALERPPRQRGALRGWLATVTQNLAHNTRRGSARRGEREQRASRPERLESHALALEQLEIQRTLFELVLALPEEKRTVLYLRYYEGLGPQAIARRLGVPVKTVKTRHTRALLELRARLDARSHGDPRAWMSALLPLARLRAFPPAGGALAGLLGGMVMKSVVAAVAVLVAAWFVWQGMSGSRPSSPEPIARAEAGSAPIVGATSVSEATAAEPPFEDVRVGGSRRPVESAPLPVTTGALVLTLTWSDGTPASGVGVDASCKNDPAPREERFTARTDEHGRARFEGLFAGPIFLELHGREAFPAEIEAGATRELALMIPAGVDVEGEVVDSAGGPVAGAEIWSEDGYSSWGGRLLATSVADGTFRLRDLGREASFGARAPGHQPSVHFQPVGLPVGPSGARVVTLVVEGAGGSIAGRVLDPSGKPLGGARIHAGPRGGFLVDLPNGLRGTSARPVPVVSDADGSFVLPGDLEPGVVHPLFVVARGYPAREEMVEVEANRRSFVEIRLEPPARIEGRVVARLGEPVANARVVAGREERGYTFEDFPPSQARTDDDGRFVLDWIASGARELHASVPLQPRLGKASAVVDCSAGATSACELVLDTGLAIRGTVVDAAGRPLTGWDVRGHTDARKGLYRPCTDMTDGDGRFVLANLAEGPCLIVVGAPGEALIPPRASLEDVLPGDEVEIVVADAGLGTGEFQGSLVGADGDAPQDVQLVLFPEADRSAGLYVELGAATGGFHGEARPGRYRLAVLRGGATVARSALFEVVEGDLVDVGELAIEAPGSVEIAIAGLPDAALSKLHFSLERVHGTSRDLELEDGRLRARELAPGTWIVVVAETELFLRGNELEVVAGETTRAELAAEPGYSVELRLAGASPRRVLVEAREPGAARLVRNEVWVDEEDRARVSLPAGLAVIDVLTDAGLRGRVEIDVGAALRNAPPVEVVLR